MVKTARDALSMDKEAKDAIKVFIHETVKVYDGLLNSITPFYGITYKDDLFRDEFAMRYETFMNMYYGSYWVKVAASCSSVQLTLNHLAQSKFINKFPFLRKKYAKLRDSSDSKLLRDYTVSDTIDAIYDEFEMKLRQIHTLLTKGNVQESANQLQLFLSETRKSFNHMQKLLGDLHMINASL